MDEYTRERAMRSGLAQAVADHPDDVAAAARSAGVAAKALVVPTAPAAEPWPPMRPA